MNTTEQETRQPNSWCEVAGQECYMNYCDENGCQERKRNYTPFGVSLLNDGDLLKYLLEQESGSEGQQVSLAELSIRLKRASAALSATPATGGEVADLIDSLYDAESEGEKTNGGEGNKYLVDDEAAIERNAALRQFADKLKATLAAALRPATAAPVWVPVSERLPEAGRDVIVWHCEPTSPRQPHSMVARLVAKHPQADEPGFYDNYGNCWLASRFTHWQPLPTPPAA